MRLLRPVREEIGKAWHSAVNVQEVAARFPGGRWTRPDNYETKCLGHDDRKASLGIAQGENGGVVVYCQAGCSTADVLQAAGLKLADLAPPNGNGNHRVEIISSYRYDDADGNLVATKHRKSDKSFLWQNAEGGWSTRGITLPLFGLPELLRSKPGDLVCIAEGEKDVLSLRKMGVIATCNPHGAAKNSNSAPKWTQADTDWLRDHLPGRRFLIFADNDEAGHAHAEVVYHALQRAGLDARYAQMEGLGKGEDISDWLGRHTAAEFQALLTEPPAGEGPFRLLTFDEVCDLPPPIWMVDGLFHEQSFVQIYGETNSGKSLVTMDLGLHLASASEEWFGHEILKPGPVVWINADGGRGITVRLLAWKEKNGAILRYPFYTLMGAVQMNRRDQMDAFRKQLLRMKEPPVLVVFDTQSRCMTGGDENGQADMTIVTDGCHQIKNEVGCTVVLLHHADKTGQWERGSGVVKNETDTQMRVDMNLDTGIGTITSKKARDGDRFQPLQFRLEKVLDSVVIIPTSTECELGESRISKQKTYEGKIIELLRCQPGGATRKMLEGQANVAENDATFYAALRELVAVGKAVKRDDPLAMGNRRKPQRYWLCGESQTSFEDIDLAD